VTESNTPPTATAVIGTIPGTGAEGVLAFGDPDTELRILRELCGVLDRSWSGGLLAAGKDAKRFLNAYLTCDVKALADGEGRYGFLTSAQGRILAALTVLGIGDDLWIDLPAGTTSATRDHLARFVIADRVEFRDLTHQPLDLIGPDAAALLARVDVEPSTVPLAHRAGSIGGVPVRVQSAIGHGALAFTVWVEREKTREALAALVDAGAAEVGFSATEVLRVEAGEPRFGIDFGAQNFPQETGQESAVSYTKGCYLGQEVVARIHYRGGVQRQLRGIAFADVVPPSGAVLQYEGRDAGALGSSLFSRRLGHGIGLAILHRRAGSVGSKLRWVAGDGAGEAEVCELPFTTAPSSEGTGTASL
jgi:folate-binding protein YgfZ